MSAMTVKKLIDYLQTLPDDTVIGVVYNACSELVILEEGDLSYHSPMEDVKECFGRKKRYVFRNGQVMEYDRKTWPPDEEPIFIGVVEFPGN